jgi:hypothetical protein
VTRVGRWEWAFAAQAVARGDLLLLLDRETPTQPATGDRLWLLPSWRNERPDAVKRSWWAEVSRSNRERPSDGSVPLRSLCDVVSAHALDDETRALIAPFHPWSPDWARQATRALVVRAYARAEPFPIHVDAGGGDYAELADDPPEQQLLPALTDEAFALHRARVERDLEAVDAPRG